MAEDNNGNLPRERFIYPRVRPGEQKQKKSKIMALIIWMHFINEIYEI